MEDKMRYTRTEINNTGADQEKSPHVSIKLKISDMYEELTPADTLIAILYYIRVLCRKHNLLPIISGGEDRLVEELWNYWDVFVCKFEEHPLLGLGLGKANRTDARKLVIDPALSTLYSKDRIALVEDNNLEIRYNTEARFSKIAESSYNIVRAIDATKRTRTLLALHAVAANIVTQLTI